MMWSNGELFCNVPLPEASDGPLVIAHPAADGNYLASWNIMVEHGQPFVLVCDDLGPRYPDDWPYHAESTGAEYFARLANPIGGGRAYRHPDLPFQNMLVHREMDALEGLAGMPRIDVLYTDWLDPLHRDGPPSFMDVASVMAEKVSDGGIILLDRKHEDTAPRWFEFPEGVFEVGPGLSLEHLGTAEWPLLTLEMPSRTEIITEVFKVSNSNRLADADDFLATLMRERRLTADELGMMKHRIPPRWHGHPCRDDWMQMYMEYLDAPSIGPPGYPYPTIGAWDPVAYRDWVQWLIENPHHLRPVERVSRTFDFGIKTTIVHGDIQDQLDWLYLKEAGLVLRNKQLDVCLPICSQLQFKATRLQPRWESPLISKLVWSGPDATPNLTRALLDLAESSVVATISHGQATLDELEGQLADYEGDVDELIIFHLDAEDYSEVSR